MTNMKWKTLILVLTGDCNFNCRYCYQNRDKRTMSEATAKRALDLFWPYAHEEVRLCFLGGEPLLAWSLIEQIVLDCEQRSKGENKKVNFALTTNGSLLDPDKLSFMERRCFRLELSFDGLAQDWGRQDNSFIKISSLTREILNRQHLQLTVNSVFTPGSVTKLRESMLLIMEMGVKDLTLSLDLTQSWPLQSLQVLAQQLADLRRDVIAIHKDTGHIPIDIYRPLTEKGIWRCNAGFEQFTLSQEGEIWGCPGFYETFGRLKDSSGYNDYCFGTMEEFFNQVGSSYKRILQNYREFTMDNFHTRDSRCFLCPLVQECSVCPVGRFSPNVSLLLVPDYICRINKILIEERQAVAGVISP